MVQHCTTLVRYPFVTQHSRSHNKGQHILVMSAARVRCSYCQQIVISYWLNYCHTNVSEISPPKILYKKLYSYFIKLGYNLTMANIVAETCS